MDPQRLKKIQIAALKLKDEGKMDEFYQTAEIARRYEAGESLSTVTSSLIGLADGILANWGDEAAGAGVALLKAAGGNLDIKKNYKDTRDTLRQYQREAELTSPYAKGIGEIVGGVGTMWMPGPTLFKAGDKGLKAIKAMKESKGMLPYLKAGAKTIHEFGKPAAVYGAISGAGRGRMGEDMIESTVGGAAGGYLIGGSLGTALGNIFYKGASEAVDTSRAGILNRARKTLDPEFVKKHEKELVEFHELIKKHGFKGKGIEEALAEAEQREGSLDQKFTSFLSQVSNFYKRMQAGKYIRGGKLADPTRAGDPTEMSAFEILEGFKGSLDKVGKKATKLESEDRMLEQILMDMKEHENQSIKILGHRDTKIRGGQNPDPYSMGEPFDTKGEKIEVNIMGQHGDPLLNEASKGGHTEYRNIPGQKGDYEDLMDRKIFNVEGQRALLQEIGKRITDKQRRNMDSTAEERLEAYLRDIYDQNLKHVMGKGEMSEFSKAEGMTPDTPTEMHELIKLKKLFESGALKEARDEAEKLLNPEDPWYLKPTRTLGKLFQASQRGTVGQTGAALSAADRLLIKDKPARGLLEITPDDLKDLTGVPHKAAEEMRLRFKPQDFQKEKGLPEFPVTTGKIGESTYNMANPDIKVNDLSPAQQIQKQMEEQKKKEYQDKLDKKSLEDTNFQETAPSKEDRRNYDYNVMVNKKQPDKLLAAVKRARANGEIISPNDPDFKKKIRKYLVDNDLEYA